MNCCCQVVGEMSDATGERQDRSLPASVYDGDKKVGVGNNYCISLSQLKTRCRDDMHCITELKQAI